MTVSCSYFHLLLLMAQNYPNYSIFAEFRECFYLYARSGQINSMNELAVIMRSLGMNPTKPELTTYMRSKNGKMAFADFLDVMHSHSTKEDLPKELLEAFRSSDPQRKGVIHAKDLRRILIRWGEQLSPKEGNYLFSAFFL